MHLVEVDRNRPDFRVFIDLLYDHDRNVDTEGDSNPVYSRTWTHLYIADRESDDPSVEIFAVEDRPGFFAVESESDRLEELTALYLFLSCGTSIADGASHLNAHRISLLKGKYSVELHRADHAVWHKSSHGLQIRG